jgi:hypothetical protein
MTGKNIAGYEDHCSKCGAYYACECKLRMAAEEAAKKILGEPLYDLNSCLNVKGAAGVIQRAIDAAVAEERERIYEALREEFGPASRAAAVIGRIQEGGD